MHRSIKKWIYVTGAPRSATTFVGKILSSGLEVDYIHEPFNPDCGIDGITQPFLYMEQDSDPASPLRHQIEKLFKYQSRLRTGYFKNDTQARKLIKRFIGSRGPFYLRMARLNPFHSAAVIKDPIGCLMTEYLARQYGVIPVVVFRHPLSFVASTLRLGWDLSLDPVVRQERLVRRFFNAADLELIEKYRHGTHIQRAAVLWRLINTVLLEFKNSQINLLAVTHEDICANPMDEFSRIFAHVGLPLTDRIATKIDVYTKGSRREARRGVVQDFKRDSSTINSQRLQLLQTGEADQILEIAGPVVHQTHPGSLY